MTDDPKTPPPSPGDKPIGRPALSMQNAFLLLLLLLILAYFATTLRETPQTTVDFPFFLEQVKAGNVREVTIESLKFRGTWVNVERADEAWKAFQRTKAGATPGAAKPEADPPQKIGERFVTEASILEGQFPLRLMEEKNVPYEPRNSDSSMLMLQFLVSLIPFLVIALFFFWMIRRSSDPMGSGMFGSFVRSQAKRFKPSDQRTTFDDVAGMEHAKRELQEVVEFLREPAKFQRLGAQIPKGVLLAGPPGTGKTLMARAVAGEAGVPFFSINGSEFIQMFVGVGASRVRDMFRQAKESSPCILFIDEIDAVGRVRGAGVGGGHDEREQTLNQILSEMDGFQTNEAVIVVAATNRPDVLDPALLRPGRFDRHVSIDLPSRQGREGILRVHVRKVPLADNVNLAEIAGSTIGFSGADLKNLVNEAALNAAREGKSQVDRHDFEAARDKIMMGVPRDDIVNAKERRMTAYHEAGHALVGWRLPETDPVHKVTIVPRGRTGGVTMFVPDEERFHMGETRLRSMLAMMLAGRAAEKLVFDEFSAGAENDLKRASEIARRMVSAWGMSEKIGPVAFRDSEEHPFLGREIHEARKFSEQTAFIIDQEMQKLLMQAQELATRTLTEDRASLDLIAEQLLKQEILDREQLVALIGPKTVDPDSSPEPNPTV